MTAWPQGRRVVRDCTRMAQPAHYVAHWVNTRLAQLKYITGTTGTLGQHNTGGIKDIMA